MGGLRKLQVSVCCGVLLALAHPAWADFVGVVAMSKEEPETAICRQTDDDFIPYPLTVCKVLVAFDDPDDRLLSVGNADLQVYNAGEPDVFFQHPFGLDTPPDCFLFAAFPSLACDSWVTLGLWTDQWCASPMDDVATDPDFDTDEFNTIGHLVGGWFLANPCSCYGQFFAGYYPDLQIPILQASMARGLSMSGTIDIFWFDPQTSQVIAEDDVLVECVAECIADFDGDGAVNAHDLAQVLGDWGPCPGCPADLNSDEVVNAADLAILLGAWGPCG